MKFLLIIIGMFAKMQHFEFKSLKSYHEIVMKMYRLQREDYWIKTLRTVYPYGLNEKTKFMNKNSHKRRFFPRYSERFIDTKTRSKITYHDLLSDIESFFNFLKQFPLKILNNESRKLLETFKKRELKLLGRQVENLQYSNL